MPSSPPDIFRRDVDLAPYNTLGISARAERYVEIEALSDIRAVLEHPAARERPLHILGGGSNVLFLGDVEGIVVRVNIRGREVIRQDDESVWVRSGAGENWHELVSWAVERGWGGIENLALIPGTVGAAPIQNIGAYGAELSTVFEQLTAVDMDSGGKRDFNREECRFAYRDSYFKGAGRGRFLVGEVVLRLSRQPRVNTSYGSLRDHLQKKGVHEPGIRDVFEAVKEIRRAKLPDPGDLANAGSFFKNPVISRRRFRELRERYPEMPHYPAGEEKIKIPAGWLIEQAGWKGRRVGPVGTYRQQALVIVNHGGASGKQVWELARKISSEVRGEFGIDLDPEVNIIGN